MEKRGVIEWLENLRKKRKKRQVLREILKTAPEYVSYTLIICLLSGSITSIVPEFTIEPKVNIAINNINPVKYFIRKNYDLLLEENMWLYPDMKNW